MSDKANENANPEAELEALRAEKDAAEAELARMKTELDKAKAAAKKSGPAIAKPDRKNFKKVESRDYESGTVRKTEVGLVVYDS